MKLIKIYEVSGERRVLAAAFNPEYVVSISCDDGSVVMRMTSGQTFNFKNSTLEDVIALAMLGEEIKS